MANVAGDGGGGTLWPTGVIPFSRGWKKVDPDEEEKRQLLKRYTTYKRTSGFTNVSSFRPYQQLSILQDITYRINDMGDAKFSHRADTIASKWEKFTGIGARAIAGVVLDTALSRAPLHVVDKAFSNIAAKWGLVTGLEMYQETSALKEFIKRGQIVPSNDTYGTLVKKDIEMYPLKREYWPEVNSKKVPYEALPGTARVDFFGMGLDYKKYQFPSMGAKFGQYLAFEYAKTQHDLNIIKEGIQDKLTTILREEKEFQYKLHTQKFVKITEKTGIRKPGVYELVTKKIGDLPRVYCADGTYLESYPYETWEEIEYTPPWWERTYRLEDERYYPDVATRNAENEAAKAQASHDLVDEIYIGIHYDTSLGQAKMFGFPSTGWTRLGQPDPATSFGAQMELAIASPRPGVEPYSERAWAEASALRFESQNAETLASIMYPFRLIGSGAKFVGEKAEWVGDKVGDKVHDALWSESLYNNNAIYRNAYNGLQEFQNKASSFFNTMFWPGKQALKIPGYINEGVNMLGVTFYSMGSYAYFKSGMDLSVIEAANMYDAYEKATPGNPPYLDRRTLQHLNVRAGTMNWTEYLGANLKDVGPIEHSFTANILLDTGLDPQEHMATVAVGDLVYQTAAIIAAGGGISKVSQMLGITSSTKVVTTMKAGKEVTEIVRRVGYLNHAGRNIVKGMPGFENNMAVWLAKTGSKPGDLTKIELMLGKTVSHDTVLKVAKAKTVDDVIKVFANNLEDGAFIDLFSPVLRRQAWVKFAGSRGYNMLPRVFRAAIEPVSEDTMLHLGAEDVIDNCYRLGRAVGMNTDDLMTALDDVVKTAGDYGARRVAVEGFVEKVKAVNPDKWNKLKKAWSRREGKGSIDSAGERTYAVDNLTKDPKFGTFDANDYQLWLDTRLKSMQELADARGLLWREGGIPPGEELTIAETRTLVDQIILATKERDFIAKRIEALVTPSKSEVDQAVAVRMADDHTDAMMEFIIQQGGVNPKLVQDWELARTAHYISGQMYHAPQKTYKIPKKVRNNSGTKNPDEMAIAIRNAKNEETGELLFPGTNIDTGSKLMEELGTYVSPSRRQRAYYMAEKQSIIQKRMGSQDFDDLIEQLNAYDELLADPRLVDTVARYENAEALEEVLKDITLRGRKGGRQIREGLELAVETDGTGAFATFDKAVIEQRLAFLKEMQQSDRVLLADIKWTEEELKKLADHAPDIAKSYAPRQMALYQYQQQQYLDLPAPMGVIAATYGTEGALLDMLFYGAAGGATGALVGVAEGDSVEDILMDAMFGVLAGSAGLGASGYYMKFLDRMGRWPGTKYNFDLLTSVWKRYLLGSPGILARIITDEPIRLMSQGVNPLDAALTLWGRDKYTAELLKDAEHIKIWGVKDPRRYFTQQMSAETSLRYLLADMHPTDHVFFRPGDPQYVKAATIYFTHVRHDPAVRAYLGVWRPDVSGRKAVERLLHEDADLRNFIANRGPGGYSYQKSVYLDQIEQSTEGMIWNSVRVMSEEEKAAVAAYESAVAAGQVAEVPQVIANLGFNQAVRYGHVVERNTMVEAMLRGDAPITKKSIESIPSYMKPMVFGRRPSTRTVSKKWQEYTEERAEWEIKSQGATKEWLEKNPAPVVPESVTRKRYTPLNPLNYMFDKFDATTMNIRTAMYSKYYQDAERVLIDTFNARGLALDELNFYRISRKADIIAREKVARSSYTGQRTALEYAFRNTVPFAPAVRDFLSFWIRESIRRPTRGLAWLNMYQKVPNYVTLDLDQDFMYKTGAALASFSEWAFEDYGDKLIDVPVLGQIAEIPLAAAGFAAKAVGHTFDVLSGQRITFPLRQLSFVTGGTSPQHAMAEGGYFAEEDSAHFAYDFVQQQFPGWGPWISMPLDYLLESFPEWNQYGDWMGWTKEHMQKVPGMELAGKGIPLNTRNQKALFYGSGLVLGTLTSAAGWLATGEYDSGYSIWYGVNLPGKLGRDTGTLKRTIDELVNAYAGAYDLDLTKYEDRQAFLAQMSRNVYETNAMASILSYLQPMNITIRDIEASDKQEAFNLYMNTYRTKYGFYETPKDEWGRPLKGEEAERAIMEFERGGKKGMAAKQKVWAEAERARLREERPEWSALFDGIDIQFLPDHSARQDAMSKWAYFNQSEWGYFKSVYANLTNAGDLTKMMEMGVDPASNDYFLYAQLMGNMIEVDPKDYVEAIGEQWAKLRGLYLYNKEITQWEARMKMPRADGTVLDPDSYEYAVAQDAFMRGLDDRLMEEIGEKIEWSEKEERWVRTGGTGSLAERLTQYGIAETDFREKKNLWKSLPLSFPNYTQDERNAIDRARKSKVAEAQAIEQQFLADTQGLNSQTSKEYQFLKARRDDAYEKLGMKPPRVLPTTKEIQMADLSEYVAKDITQFTEEDAKVRNFVFDLDVKLGLQEWGKLRDDTYQVLKQLDASNIFTRKSADEVDPEVAAVRDAYITEVTNKALANPDFRALYEWSVKQRWERLRDMDELNSQSWDLWYSSLAITTKALEKLAKEGGYVVENKKGKKIWTQISQGRFPRSEYIAYKNQGKQYTAEGGSKTTEELMLKLRRVYDELRAGDEQFKNDTDFLPLTLWDYYVHW